MSDQKPGGQRGTPYAAQWPLFTAFCAVMAALVVAGAKSPIFAFGAQLLAVAGMFVAGFCYREHLRQRGQGPRLKWFQRMLG